MRKICLLLILLFDIDGSQAQIHKEQSIEGNIDNLPVHEYTLEMQVCFILPGLF